MLDLLDMMVKKKLAKTRELAAKLAIRLQNKSLIIHVHGNHIFKDDPNCFFRFPSSVRFFDFPQLFCSSMGECML